MSSIVSNNHYSIAWDLRNKINDRFDKIENQTKFQIAEGAFWVSKPFFFLGSLAEVVLRVVLYVFAKIAARFEEDLEKKAHLQNFATTEGFNGAQNSFGAACLYLFDKHAFKSSQ